MSGIEMKLIDERAPNEPDERMPDERMPDERMPDERMPDERMPDERMPDERTIDNEIKKMNRIKWENEFIHFQTSAELYDALIDPTSNLANFAKDGKILSFCCNGCGVSVAKKMVDRWMVDHIEYVPDNINDRMRSHLETMGYNVR